ncbi:uncharacterized protein CDAR_426121 [Caerostris darwini]|uniref:Uncharacterized protein n=1 Tax=Caerostris darwini TaxID=1538125 RepID=A0AAV4WUW9_9ARAC|nr:uncharacterized protein CDAR_426121 [Caerostris darwini]
MQIAVPPPPLWVLVSVSNPVSGKQVVNIITYFLTSFTPFIWYCFKTIELSLEKLMLKLKSKMACVEFCFSVVDKEIKKFNLDFNVYRSYVGELTAVTNKNFDIAYNRCAFMYKCGIFNMYFFKACFTKFLLEYSDFGELVLLWKSLKNVKLCSISCGPGLEYLSFMSTLLEHTTISIKDVMILSKHGAWRNTVNIVSDIINEGTLESFGIPKKFNFRNVKVLQADLFNRFPEKGMAVLRDSDIIFMIRSLNLANLSDINKRSKLKEIIVSLKPEATIFFVETKSNSNLISEVLGDLHGKFLYNPINLSYKVPIMFPENFTENHGPLPTLNNRGIFFVWQKMFSSDSDPNLSTSLLKELHIEKTDNKSKDEKNYSCDISNKSDVVSSKNMSLESDTDISTKIIEELICPKTPELECHGAINILQSKQEENKSSDLVTVEDFSTCSNDLINDESNSVHILQQNLHIPGTNSKSSNFADNRKSYSASLIESNDNINLPNVQLSSKNLSSFEEHKLWNSPPIKLNSEISKTTLESESIEKKESNIFEINHSAKLSLKSEAVQTDKPIKEESIALSDTIRCLTERVKQLITSLESELKVQNNCDQPQHFMHKCMGHPSSPVFASKTKNTDSNIKSSYDANQSHDDDSIDNYDIAQSQSCPCCTHNHMIHSCEMPASNESCMPKCYFQQPMLSCSNTNINLTAPSIIIPLENIDMDTLSQIILANKSASKSEINPHKII